MPSPLRSLRQNASRLWGWVASRLGGRTAAARELAFRRREERRLRGLRLRPEFEPLEWREVPNDPLGLLQAPLLGSGLALLGASLRTPASVLAHGWGDQAAPPPADPATPSRLADDAFELSPAEPAASPRLAPAPSPAAPTPATGPQAPPDESAVRRREGEWGLGRSTEDWLAEVGLAINTARQRLAAEPTAAPPPTTGAGPGGTPTGGGALAGSGTLPAAVAGAAPAPADEPPAFVPPADPGAATPPPRASKAPRPVAGPTAPPTPPAAAGAANLGSAPTAPPAAPEGVPSPEPDPGRPVAAALNPDFGRQRLIFEANVGQAGPDAAFVARARDHALLLSPTRAVLTLPTRDPDTGQRAYDALTLEFIGANPNAVLRGAGELTSRSNYFRGGEHPLQLTDVPNYASVVAEGLYPGVDVVYHSDAAGQLEYDLRVQPGASASAVRVAFTGATSMHLDGQGRLVLDTPAGRVIQESPVLYQEGPGGRRENVPGRFTLVGEDEIGFVPGDYDSGRELVIDPVLSFDAALGGGATAKAYAVANDLSGNTYVAGVVESTGLGSGYAYDPVFSGYRDAFVSKYGPDGQLIYATYLGAIEPSAVPTEAFAVAADAAGYAYVTGGTASGDYPTTPDGYLVSGGGGFLTKLTPAGNALAYSTFLGTSSFSAVAVDPAGAAYVAGTYFSGMDHGAVVLKMNSAGSDLSYSVTLNGSGDDHVQGIALAPGGEAIVVGYTNSGDFPTESAYDATHNGGYDAFVTRLSADGLSKVYSTFLGGSSDDQAYAVAVDPVGQVYLTGATGGAFPTTVGAFDTSANGSSSVFVSKLSATGASVLYSTYLGGDGDMGTGAQEGRAIALDPASEGLVTVAGWTTAFDFPTAYPTQGSIGSWGTSDAFVAQLNPAGSDLLFSTFYGGAAEEFARGVAIDIDGNTRVVGGTAVDGGFAFLAEYVPLVLRFTAVDEDTGSSAADQTTTDQTLTLIGEATPFTLVTIYRAGTGRIGTTTADEEGDWSFDYTAVTLPEGGHAFTATGTLAGYTSPHTPPFRVNVDRTAPALTLTVDTATHDTTPRVLVSATDLFGFPDNATVSLDVDLNNDNDFADASETGYTTGTLADGLAVLTVSPALAVGTVRMRARVTDKAGNEGTSTAVTVTVSAPGTPWTITNALPVTDALLGDPTLQAGTLGVWHALDLDASPGTGVAGGMGLAYSSARVDVRPIVQANIQSDTATALPATITVQLTWNGGSPQTPQTLGTGGLSPGDLITVAQQVSSAVSTTGRYTWSLQVTMNYGSPIVRTLTGASYVVAEDASVLGAGWALGGTDRLVSIGAQSPHPAGLLRVFGEGYWAFYELSGSAYLSPAGDGGTLASLGVGAGYRYTAPDGTTRDYDSNGKLTKKVSADGFETTTYTYSSGDPATIQTPDGVTTTFAYSSGKVQTITTGSRVVTLTHSGSNLTNVTNPDGALRSLTYDGAHRLTRDEFGVLSTTYAYDSYLLAGWTPSGGGPTALSPAVKRGLGSLAAGEAEATVTDALGRVTRIRPDGKGQALRTVRPDGSISYRTYDAKGWLATETDALNRTTTYTRDAAGYVTQQQFPDGSTLQLAYQSAFHALTTFTDERGFTTTFAYDGNGHLTRRTDALGNATTFSWDTGLLKTVTDALGGVTTFTYDNARRLESVKDALGGLFTVTYDGNGNAATARDQLGRTTTFSNDALGRLTQLTDAAGGLWTFVYDGSGLLRSTKDALGRLTTYAHDGRGLVTRQIEAVGTPVERLTVYGYDEAGRRTLLRDGNGWVWSAEYDAVGRLVRWADPRGASWGWDYDLAGQQTGETDALGARTAAEYHARGWLTKITDALGGLSSFAYDAGGNLTGSTDALGTRGTYAYDARGLLTAATQAVGTALSRSWSVGHDALGRVLSVTDPLGHTTTAAYDALSRLVRLTEGLGTSAERTATVAYDAAGNLASATDPLNHLTTFAYDALNRMTSMTEAVGSPAARTVTAAYDAVSNLTGVTDGLGQRTAYRYDALDRPTGVTEASGTALARSLTFVYDALGRVAVRIDGLGRATQTGFDALGRAVAARNGVDALGRAWYDALGNVVVSDDAAGNRTEFAYDRLSRLMWREDALGGVFTWAYDAAGNVTGATDARGNRGTFAYDALSRLVQVTDALGGLATLIYDAADNVTAGVDPLGNRTTYSYDALDRLVQVTDALGGLFTVVYDAGSNVVASVDPLGNRTTYSYDALDRLVQTTDAGGGLWTAVYDAADNVTRLSDARGNRTTLSYDGLNRLVQSQDAAGGLASVVYNAADEVVASVDPLGNRTTFSYDRAGRLVQIKDALGGLFTLVYDRVGNVRAGTDALGNRTTYTYDALNRPVQTTDALGGLWTSVYDANSNVVASVDARGNRTTYSYDGLNRIVQVTDALGGLWTAAYDAASNLVASVDARGNRTTYSYDALHRTIQVRDALNGLSTVVYDAASNVLAGVDQLGNRTTFAYDALNRPVQTTDALGGLWTAVYDATSNVVASVDARGNRTTFSYDGLNRLTQVQDALGGLASVAYDAASNVRAGVDQLGNRTTYSYDALNRPVQTQDALGGLWTAVYDANSNVVASVDARGNRTTFSYDALNRTIQVRDALDGLATLVYDATSNVIAAVDPLGNRTTFAYDALNRAIQTTDALGGLWTTAYDATSNVAVSVDALGRRTTYSHDALNRPTQTQDVMGGLWTVAYDAASNVAATVDALGRRTTYSHDALNRTIQVRDALNGLATVAYDAVSNVVASVDQLGNRTTFAYDALDRVSSVKDPLGNTFTFGYDAASNRRTVTNPRGYTTTASYDALNRPVQVTDALGNLGTMVYDATSNVIATVDGRGARTTYGYDALNRTVSVKDALSHTNTVVYDAAGNVSRSIDALGNAVTFGYDALNRPVSTKDAGGGTWTTAYDAVSNVTAQVDPLGNRTTMTYDALDRVVTTKDALGGVVTLLYDAVSNTTGLIDPVGNRTTFVYDALDRTTEEKDPLGASLTYAYDAASRLTSATDRLGRRRDFSYDAASRLTGQTWVNVGGATADLLTYTYDANDNLLSAANGSGAYTMTYDALDRVATTQQPFGFGQTFSYDAAGNRTRVEDSLGGVVTSVYDLAGRLTQRQLGGATPLRVDLTYTDRDQLASETRYSDLTGTTKVGESAYTYDAVGRLTNLQHKTGAGANISNFTYTYDQSHRATSETRNGVTTSYGYDAIDQVTSAGSEAFSYDGAGNRTTSGYQTGAANRLSNDGTYTYSYDANGSLTKRSKGAAQETWTYGYDQSGRLLWAEKRATDGGTLQMRSDYTYDAFGNRLSKSVDPDGAGASGTEVTRFAYDGWKNPVDSAGNPYPLRGNENWDVVADLNGSNALQTRYLSGDGIDQHFARVGGAGANWLLSDRLGSVRDVTDGSGAVVNHIDYGAYGQVLSESSPSSGGRYKFSGREYDAELGWNFHHDRHSDPVTGRWVGEDPVGFGAGDFNLNRFAGNSPTLYTDPSGLQVAPGGLGGGSLSLSASMDANATFYTDVGGSGSAGGGDFLSGLPGSTAPSPGLSEAGSSEIAVGAPGGESSDSGGLATGLGTIDYFPLGLSLVLGAETSGGQTPNPESAATVTVRKPDGNFASYTPEEYRGRIEALEFLMGVYRAAYNSDPSELNPKFPTPYLGKRLGLSGWGRLLVGDVQVGVLSGIDRYLRTGVSDRDIETKMRAAQQELDNLRNDVYVKTDGEVQSVDLIDYQARFQEIRFVEKLAASHKKGSYFYKPYSPKGSGYLLHVGRLVDQYLSDPRKPKVVPVATPSHLPKGVTADQMRELILQQALALGVSPPATKEEANEWLRKWGLRRPNGDAGMVGWDTNHAVKSGTADEVAAVSLGVALVAAPGATVVGTVGSGVGSASGGALADRLNPGDHTLKFGLTAIGGAGGGFAGGVAGSALQNRVTGAMRTIAQGGATELRLATRAYRGRPAVEEEIVTYVRRIETNPNVKAQVRFIEQMAEGPEKAAVLATFEAEAKRNPAIATQGLTYHNHRTKTWEVVFRDRNTVKAAALYEEYLHINQIAAGVIGKKTTVTIPGGRDLHLTPEQAAELDAAVRMLRHSRVPGSKLPGGAPMVSAGDMRDKAKVLAHHYLKEHKLMEEIVEELLEHLADTGWALR